MPGNPAEAGHPDALRNNRRSAEDAETFRREASCGWKF